ncbi:hypothetical protein [Paremcibacter congregatus]|uniref:hypothetical protein n=1 Tax=Paremcibacter congregatus TaxID=2043170 RepID=UPI0030ECD4EC|tara:strand:- start:14112 stop:14303 length:192 start_codon:yes stop_codon:yes gene_type:complete
MIFETGPVSLKSRINDNVMDEDMRQFGKAAINVGFAHGEKSFFDSETFMESYRAEFTGAVEQN